MQTLTIVVVVLTFNQIICQKIKVRIMACLVVPQSIWIEGIEGWHTTMYSSTLEQGVMGHFFPQISDVLLLSHFTLDLLYDRPKIMIYMEPIARFFHQLLLLREAIIAELWQYISMPIHGFVTLVSIAEPHIHAHHGCKIDWRYTLPGW
ncbi:hypothetical protein ACJX0J_030194, partial [Zea mays]